MGAFDDYINGQSNTAVAPPQASGSAFDAYLKGGSFQPTATSQASSGSAFDAYLKGSSIQPKAAPPPPIQPISSNLTPLGNNTYRTPSGTTWQVDPTTGMRQVSLAPQFGGGAYTVNPQNTNQPVLTGHTTYGGLPQKPGFQRNDLIPQSLGGINASPQNIQYQPGVYDKSTGKFSGPAGISDALETQAAQQVKSGQLPLGQARLQAMMRNQKQVSPLETFFTALSQIYSPQNIQQTAQNPLGTQPKSQGMTFAVGQGLNPKQQMNAQSQIIKEQQLGSQPVPQTPSNMDLVGGAKQIARIIPRAVAETTQAFLPTKYQQPIEPLTQSPFFKFLMGDQTLKPLAQQAVETEQQLKTNGFGKASTPLAVLGVAANDTLALYPLLSPLMSIADEAVAQLAREASTKELVVTFSDAQKITSGVGIETVPQAKIDAFKAVANDHPDLLKAFQKEGGLVVTQTQETAFSRFLKKASGGTPQEGASYSLPNTPKPMGNPFTEAIKQQPPEPPVTPKPAPETAITPKPDLQPLAQEAQKYKSAEEFVKAQKPVYRGGKKLDISKINDEGLPVTYDNKVAEQFARSKNQFAESPAGQIMGYQKGQNIVETHYISPNAKIATKADIPEEIFNAYKQANPLTKPDIAEPIVVKWAKDNGFDAIDFRTLGKTSAKEAEIKILNSDVLKTKSQLTDFYNQATKTGTPALTETVKPAQQGTPSKIAQSIEQKAVEAKLTTGFDGIAGYDKITIKDQAQKATDLINSNLDQARAVIRGDQPLPAGLKGTALITAMEEHIKQTGDVSLAHELANSPLVSGTSAAAQEMRLAAERTPDNASAKLAEIKKAYMEKAGGEKAVAQKKAAVVSQLREATNKVNLSKDELSWEKFLQGIQC